LAGIAGLGIGFFLKSSIKTNNYLILNIGFCDPSAAKKAKLDYWVEKYFTLYFGYQLY
jgi:hypothetical protein